MPHVIIEYSDQLAPQIKNKAILKTVHETMIKSGLFNPGDIKSRIYEVKDFLVGEKAKELSFIHTRVYLLEGRTLEQRKTLGESIYNELIKNLDSNHISVDVREMDKEIYKKKKN